MKATQRIDLISRIGRELQSRYTYTEIDSFLHAFDVEPPQEVSTNSKWVYSREALRSVPDAKLLKIASDLDIDLKANKLSSIRPPRAWPDETIFRLFISHISVHKAQAHRLKEALSVYHINGFVAHDDINPTLQWQHEIECALNTMDAMLSLHTKGFSASVWTQQEIGFALGRGVLVIPFKLHADEDPKGFLSKNQAVLRRSRNAEQIAEEVYQILSADPLTSTRMQAVQAMHNKVPDDDDEIPF